MGIMNSNYLYIMKHALTASLYPESAWKLLAADKQGGLRSKIRNTIIRLLKNRSFLLVKTLPFDRASRESGEDWPMFGFSMIGHKRLDNIADCLQSVVTNRVPGDFVECGVWRGGASIFARAVLNEIGARDRTVWLADSFEGMPVRKEKDFSDPALETNLYLKVSVEQVRENFERFGLLDSNVKFIKGWFCDTLAKSEIKSIGVLRLDGDYYSSTMDALNALYDRVSDGGYVIVDDYNAFASCKTAIHDFCTQRGIAPNFVPIDRHAIYWQKEQKATEGRKESALASGS